MASAAALYHMVELARWRACQAAQQPYLPPTYEQDGFTHLSADPALLLTVANHFYTSAPGEWAVLIIDPAKLSAPVLWEPAAPVGDKQSSGLLKGDGAGQEKPQEPLFPHLYGALELEAVTAELPMQRAADGTFLSIDGL